MTNSLLLPARFKMIGWGILIPATLAGLFSAIKGFQISWLHVKVFALFGGDSFSPGNEIAKNQNFTFITTDITLTLIAVLFLVGALIVSFSKEKIEDEFITKLRLSSLLWSVWVHYILLLVAFIFVWGFSFMDVMIYNMFTILIIFIIRFNYILYKNSKTVTDEK